MSTPAADPALLVNPRSRTYLVRVETVNVTESNKRTTTKTVHLNEETGEKNFHILFLNIILCVLDTLLMICNVALCCD